MGQNKGLVMSVEGEKTVVITPEGEFKEYNFLGAKVGEEITLPESKRTLPYWLAAAVLMLLVISGATLGSQMFFPAGEVYAYVSVDINPSVELAVSNQDIVKEVVALNEDGEQLLSNVSLMEKKLDDAVGELIGAAHNLGYLRTNDSAVLFGVTSLKEDEKKEKALRERLKEVVKKKVTSVSPQVAAVSVGKNLRQEANKSGLSPGKYAILLEAQEEDLNVTRESMAKGSIANVIKAAGGHPGYIISRAEKDKRLKDKDYKKLFKEPKEKQKEEEEKNRVDYQEPKKSSKGIEKKEEKQEKDENKTEERRDDRGKEQKEFYEKDEDEIEKDFDKTGPNNGNDDEEERTNDKKLENLKQKKKEANETKREELKNQGRNKEVHYERQEGALKEEKQKGILRPNVYIFR